MTSLPWLDTEFLWFPPPEEALEEPDGLLALGGDLAPQRLVHAYQNGIFPWFSDDQPILWWSPNPRCVLFPNEVHISRSLKRTLNKGYFRITADQAFSDVIYHCATVREEGTWITADMIAAYTTLHHQGTAHSFEAWNPSGELVGGLYGIALGKCFFGESMFSLETDASKALVVAIAHQLDAWGYQVMDCQVESSHLVRMGARCIARSEFLSILKKYAQTRPDHTSWAMEWRWPGGSSGT